ncbi:MAG: molybdenum cofactor biosynthesis protein MoaE [Gemmatimonadaceae bacterium]
MRTTVVERPLDPSAILEEVSAPANGATVLFVGTVREMNAGRPVVGVDYSAYGEMARSELDAIVGQASARYETAHIVVEHRVGALDVGEASVVIAVAHPRRAQAFDAARFVIEALKQRVPIWKRERYADGTREWTDPTRAPEVVG